MPREDKPGEPGQLATPPAQQPAAEPEPESNPTSSPGVAVDPWGVLRRFTQARIALGHAGTSLPTRPHLEFQLAHARARDAVHRALDAEALRAPLAACGLQLHRLHSAAGDRHTYLQRPDLGRKLDVRSREQLLELRASKAGADADVLFVLADGLSARAIQDNAVPLLNQIVPRLSADGFVVAPLAITVEQGRVAVGDEIGELLGVRLVALLVGERPGLSSPDSMGIYLSYAPRSGMTDAERNCISNIRPEGLSYALAAHKLHYLIGEACRRGLTGVTLKDEASDPANSLDSNAIPAARRLTGDHD